MLECSKLLSYFTAICISPLLLFNVFLCYFPGKNAQIGWGIIAMIASLSFIEAWKRWSTFFYFCSVILLMGLFFKMQNNGLMEKVMTWGVNSITIMSIGSAVCDIMNRRPY